MSSSSSTKGSAADMQAAIAAMGPPYAPQAQSLGSPPSPIPDVPVSAVFLVLFLVTGLAHIALFVRNKRAGHKFVFSIAMFIFCIIRVLSATLRVAWSYHSRNIKLGLAEQIFIAAGTVILYIINLFFAQRLMRARHPSVGWSRPFSVLMPPAFVVLIIVGIIMVIVAVTQSFYTLNPSTRRIDHDIQWAVLSYFTFVAFLPIPLVVIMMAVPGKRPVDNFGSGRFSTKLVILVCSSAILTLGAAFRCGTAFLPSTLLTAPTPWYYSKASFYCFDLLTEFLVVASYLIVRIDRRVYVPDGAKRPGSYMGAEVLDHLSPLDIRDYRTTRDGQRLTLADGRLFTLADASSVSNTHHSGVEERGVSSDQRAGGQSMDSRNSRRLTVDSKSGQYQWYDNAS